MSDVTGVGGASGPGGVEPSKGLQGNAETFAGIQAGKMNEMKDVIMEKLGKEKGEKTFQDFQKMLMTNVIQSMQKSAQHALEAQKKARQKG